ncbi:hypothetical protein BDEG_26066 [Batrachochytrium dendrobatidis JEL423]|uniref:Amino acid transporter transmembrane domain-containing protein n=1 Tax=Batrachochytrium dendrobatidis (strain JEL423) TaxID=403673 RepID=A0A177WR82_BATDL|nr:hypothetical protein BDEG_26066 [Batrachochytrium dendrobatidis JEL423]
MQAIPGNLHFQGSVEYATLINFYSGPWQHIVGQVFLYGALQSNAIQNIVLASQASDQLLVAIFGKSCGLAIDKAVTGWIVMVMVIPFGVMNIDDNMGIQVGLDAQKMPILASPSWSYGQVTGTVMLNLAITTIIPSWINLKRKDVNVQKVVWLSLSFVTGVFITFGVFLALGFNIGPSNNILPVLSSMGPPVILSKITVFLFAYVMLIPSIPVNLIISKGNLFQNKITSEVSNFIVPMMIYLKCHEFRRVLTPKQRDLLKSIHDTSTTIKNFIDLPKKKKKRAHNRRNLALKNQSPKILEVPLSKHEDKSHSFKINTSESDHDESSIVATCPVGYPIVVESSTLDVGSASPSHIHLITTHQELPQRENSVWFKVSGPDNDEVSSESLQRKSFDGSVHEVPCVDPTSCTDSDDKIYLGESLDEILSSIHDETHDETHDTPHYLLMDVPDPDMEYLQETNMRLAQTTRRSTVASFFGTLGRQRKPNTARDSDQDEDSVHMSNLNPPTPQQLRASTLPRINSEADTADVFSPLTVDVKGNTLPTPILKFIPATLQSESSIALTPAQLLAAPGRSTRFLEPVINTTSELSDGFHTPIKSLQVNSAVSCHSTSTTSQSESMLGDEEGGSFVKGSAMAARLARAQTLPVNPQFKSPAFRSVPKWIPFRPKHVAWVILIITTLVTVSNGVLNFISPS